MNFFRTRRGRHLFGALLAIGAVGVATPVDAEDEASAYIVVVNGDRAVDVVSDHFRSAGVEVSIDSKGAIDFVSADLSLEQLLDIRGRPGVRQVERDAQVKVADGAQVIDSSHGIDNWGLDRVDQATATLDGQYRPINDGSGIDIYILDTGIQLSHTEFTGRIASGYVVPGLGASADDDCGHGTHVAGIAAGSRYGTAKKATIVPVKIFPGGSKTACDDGTTVGAAIDGINWILRSRSTTRPAVANLSLGVSGSNPDSSIFDQAVRNLAEKMPVVVAAGNDGTLTSDRGYIDNTIPLKSASPACTSRKPDPDRNNQLTPAIITVGATGGLGDGPNDSVFFDGVDREARYSNHGPCVDIFAPGSDVISAWPYANAVFGSWGGGASSSATYRNNGTSMAAPFVAGAIAMYLKQAPQSTPSEATSQVLTTARTGVLEILTRVGAGTASPNRLLYTCAANCVPSAPRNVTVTRASRTAIDVTWEAPESTSGLAVTGYTATAAVAGGASVTCTSTTLTCRLENLVAGATYSITVVATNSAGSGASSATKSLSAGAAPSAPGTPTMVAGNGEIQVTWTVPTDNGGLAISKYTVTSTPESKTCSPTGAELSCVVTGLAVGTKYTFSVSATNDAGTTASAASAPIAPKLPWEYVPAFASVVPGNMKVDLQWTEARVLGAAPAGYFTGYVVKDASGAVVCTTTALKCTVAKLKNATKASYTVEATTVADSSEVATSAEVLVGGVRQTVYNAMRRGTSALLAKIATTNSKGKVTWRALSGGCRVVGRTLVAPASGKSCKLRVSVAKSGAFPAQTLSVSVLIL